MKSNSGVLERRTCSKSKNSSKTMICNKSWRYWKLWTALTCPTLRN